MIVMDKICLFTAINLFILAKVALSELEYNVVINPAVNRLSEEQPEPSDEVQQPAPTKAANGVAQELNARHEASEEGEYYDDYDDDYYYESDGWESNAAAQNNNENEINPANTETETTTRRNEQPNNEILEEHHRIIRIELLKLELLQKLGLTEPPNISFPLYPLPEPIVREEAIIEEREYQREQEYRSAHEKLTHVSSFGIEVEDCQSNHRHPMQCFQFDLKKDLPINEIDSAELWIYKLPLPVDPARNHTIRLSKRQNVRHKKCGWIGSQEVESEEGWIKFDVKHTVSSWLRLGDQSQTPRIFELECKTCVSNETISLAQSSGNNKPFIMFKMKGVKHRRNKRAYDCGPNTVGCCRQSLRLNFTEIGWHFIRVPQVFYPNYCRGTCSLAVDPGSIATGTKHSDIMRLAGRAGRQLCCAPTRMSSMSVIYVDEAGHMIGNVVENMRVEECGCI